MSFPWLTAGEDHRCCHLHRDKAGRVQRCTHVPTALEVLEPIRNPLSTELPDRHLLGPAGVLNMNRWARLPHPMCLVGDVPAPGSGTLLCPTHLWATLVHCENNDEFETRMPGAPLTRPKECLLFAINTGVRPHYCAVCARAEINTVRAEVDDWRGTIHLPVHGTAVDNYNYISDIAARTPSAENLRILRDAGILRDEHAAEDVLFASSSAHVAEAREYLARCSAITDNLCSLRLSATPYVAAASRAPSAPADSCTVAAVAAPRAPVTGVKRKRAVNDDKAARPAKRATRSGARK